MIYQNTCFTSFTYFRHLQMFEERKRFVLLRRKISLKDICEKSNFQTGGVFFFAKIFMTMNGHTSKLFKNILYDVQIECKGEINTA